MTFAVSASGIEGAEFDADVAKLMEREHVVGMAPAVIEDGHVTHIASYGYRNARQQLPLTVDSVMDGAWAEFAYRVMRLVDETAMPWAWENGIAETATQAASPP